MQTKALAMQPGGQTTEINLTCWNSETRPWLSSQKNIFLNDEWRSSDFKECPGISININTSIYPVEDSIAEMIFTMLPSEALHRDVRIQLHPFDNVWDESTETCKIMFKKAGSNIQDEAEISVNMLRRCYNLQLSTPIAQLPDLLQNSKDTIIAYLKIRDGMVIQIEEDHHDEKEKDEQQQGTNQNSFTSDKEENTSTPVKHYISTPPTVHVNERPKRKNAAKKQKYN
ncbi:hypothetical protein CEUSTIGMA_g796.t1 [Chlamydomonas eustigma]|uniref:Uncharacterized protein n=1 Tax=Chlamydomonas eustigma TaxID=1157962 RepID=A0A250WR98_9CHLO|nr:hypothetical protein CEUSTIGMA_g796.t1 [Chlamydomonas eustigma]|eukprot:GAX73343.1 hypothetical protein CEUSTIGMA_g796.t1 [Chlamydomonas eustigma]